MMPECNKGPKQTKRMSEGSQREQKGTTKVLKGCQTAPKATKRSSKGGQRTQKGTDERQKMNL